LGKFNQNRKVNFSLQLGKFNQLPLSIGEINQMLAVSLQVEVWSSGTYNRASYQLSIGEIQPKSAKLPASLGKFNQPAKAFIRNSTSYHLTKFKPKPAKLLPALNWGNSTRLPPSIVPNQTQSAKQCQLSSIGEIQPKPGVSEQFLVPGRSLPFN
jgi:hypothetical protein